MKKKRLVMRFPRESLLKLVLKMKLLTFLMFVGLAAASASTYSQMTRFSLNLNNVTIKEVFQQIEDKSEFILLYNEKDVDVNRKVDVKVKGETVESILNQVFEGTKNVYKIYDRQIVILENEKSEVPEFFKGKEEQQQLPQKREISGRVNDSKGQPLPGVTVLVKGTAIGTITDANGNFILQVPVNSKTLVFSFVGMKTQEVVIENKANFNVILEEETLGVEEVVVVAYGTQKKISVTGAVSSVVTKELKQSPSPNLVGAMTGRLPGLVTVQNSGQPGAEGFNIYLRGASTTNGQNPLILIDGVPRDNITVIDPNEIASVSILKDASSTAVFGVRGANGVILVTTKRGITEIPQLNFTADFGLQDFTTRFQSLDSWVYAGVRNLARANDGLTPQFSQESIEKYKSGVDPYLYPNTDWFDLLTRKNTPISRYNLNYSGGTERLKYFMNAGYTHQGGMFNTEPKSKLGYDPQFKMDRYNFRTNLDININSWIKSSVNLAGYIQKVNGSCQSNRSGTPFYVVLGFYGIAPTTIGPLTREGYGVPADEPVVAPIGNEIPSFAQLNRSGQRVTETSNLNSSLSFDFDLNRITKGLTSKVMVSYDYNTSGLTDVYRDYNGYAYTITQVPDPVTGQLKDKVAFWEKWTAIFNPIILSKSATFSYKINAQLKIDYARTFNNRHQVTGMILAQRDNYEVASGSSDLLLPYNVLGVSGRASYGYDNRYLLEFNAGYNGSEQFARARRFGFFPAASLGWVISNEQFMKAQKILTNLKLRASYGKVGNDLLGSNRFLYLDNVATASGGFSESLGLGKYINEILIGNPNISWETATKQNYGLEFTFLKDLSFEGDLFFEDRTGILITRGTVPAIQGLPLNVVPKANMGEVTNKGFELELVYNKTINRDLSFVVSGNYNYNHNTVINIDEPPNDETYPYRYLTTGYSLSQNWGYLIDWNSVGKGYFTSDEEITNSGLIYSGVKPKPGDFVYKDLNGDKIINNKDQAPIKYGYVPRVTFGANVSVTYKGFDFSSLWQGVAQTSQYYSSWGIMEGTVGNYSEIHLHSWTKERYEAGEKITYPRLTTLGSNASKVPNDFFILDRSYIRLKNAEIGYTLSKPLLKHTGIQNMRIYANGQNIFVWSKLTSRSLRFDPEQSSPTSLPIIRVFNLGINLVF